MKLQQRVEVRIGEPVALFLQRKAQQGSTIRAAANQLDVSYTTCHKWQREYKIKFNKGNNPFNNWKLR
jgi:molybdenum-dependent DNA-binding transcriptional regulator ModE